MQLKRVRQRGNNLYVFNSYRRVLCTYIMVVLMHKMHHNPHNMHAHKGFILLTDRFIAVGIVRGAVQPIHHHIKMKSVIGFKYRIGKYIDISLLLAYPSAVEELVLATQVHSVALIVVTFDLHT